MVNYIIIEDERPAFEELRRMVGVARPNYKLTGWADSIEQSKIILTGTKPDLVFMDIHLSDGNAFEIFNDYCCETPIVFTTAYNEYALDAFRAGGIDYLLKPIEEAELERALGRFERGQIRPISEREGKYRKRFLVKVGDSYLHISVDSVAFFHSEDKCTFATLQTGKSYIIETSLDSLANQLDPTKFFRVSRSSMVNVDSIIRCTKLFGGRLHIYMKVESDREIIVSRGRASAFLNWFEGI